MVRVSQSITFERVAWSITRPPESDGVRLECFDSLTQQRYHVMLPLRVLPSLARLLNDAIDAHAEDFPLVVADQAI